MAMEEFTAKRIDEQELRTSLHLCLYNATGIHIRPLLEFIVMYTIPRSVSVKNQSIKWQDNFNYVHISKKECLRFLRENKVAKLLIARVRNIEDLNCFSVRIQCDSSVFHRSKTGKIKWYEPTRIFLVETNDWFLPFAPAPQKELSSSHRYNYFVSGLYQTSTGTLFDADHIDGYLRHTVILFVRR